MKTLIALLVFAVLLAGCDRAERTGLFSKKSSY